MAITEKDLIADIEKRMVALGYEDLEELYSPDHDIKSLKDLKRRLMDEAKEAKEQKKERTKYTKEFRNLFVKLTKVYRKDFYIYNGTYAIPGKISEESLKGKFILSIKEQYRRCVNEILFPDNENTILFIKDISEIKNVVDEFIEEKDKILPACLERGLIQKLSEEKFNEIKDKITTELDKIQQETEFFIPVEVDLSDPEVISLKKIFKMQYKDFPPIEGNIQLFPFFTENDKPFIEFMSEEFDNGGGTKLYYARFHIDYTIFDIYFKIYYF